LVIPEIPGRISLSNVVFLIPGVAGLAGLCMDRGAMHEPACVCHLPFPTSIWIRLRSHVSETVPMHSLLPETKNVPEKEFFLWHPDTGEQGSSHFFYPARII